MGGATIPPPPITPAAPDRLGLADVMILIAIFAFGLAWLRIELRGHVEADWTFYTPYSAMTSRMQVSQSKLMTAAGRFEDSVPILGSVTLGLVLIQLRRPGFFSASPFGRPGLLACLAASLPIGAYLARRTFAVIVESLQARAQVQGLSGAALGGEIPISGRLLTDLAYPAGLAVAATWVVSSLGPPRGVRLGPIDRAGRWVGIYWLAAIAIRIVFELLWKLSLGGLI